MRPISFISHLKSKDNRLYLTINNFNFLLLRQLFKYEKRANLMANNGREISNGKNKIYHQKLKKKKQHQNIISMLNTLRVFTRCVLSAALHIVEMLAISLKQKKKTK